MSGFIGQGTKAATAICEAEKGLNQKDQSKILESFNKGDLNVLVATSIAEEGKNLSKFHKSFKINININIIYNI